MTTDYTYGDGKTGDATNFGIFKQNWFMLRTSTEEFMGETVDQVDDGAILKYDLILHFLDISKGKSVHDTNPSTARIWVKM